MPNYPAPPRRGFASDNFAGIHPAVLEAIVAANVGHAPAYGGDEYTAMAVARCREHFGADVEVAFVFNGTGANVLSLASAMQPHHAVICSEHAHIYVDECGAPERFTGGKLLPVSAPDGKLPADVTPALRAAYDFHIWNERTGEVRLMTAFDSTEEDVDAFVGLFRQAGRT